MSVKATAPTRVPVAVQAEPKVVSFAACDAELERLRLLLAESIGKHDSRKEDEVRRRLDSWLETRFQLMREGVSK